MAAPAPAQESSNDLSPRCKTVVLVNAYEKEMVHNLAKHALGSRIPFGAGSAIVDIGNSRIIVTSLSVESNNGFTELLKRLPTVAVDTDDTIVTKIKERVAAALNYSGKPMIREHNLPLVIVCSSFEKGNGFLAPMVDVWAGPEELELTWQGPDNNFEFTVMDLRKTLSPAPLRGTPLVTFLGHYYPLTGHDSSGDIMVDSIAWNHIVSDKGRLEDFKKYATPRMARLRDGTNVPILGVGNMKTEAIDVPHVEFAPDLKVDFISVNQLDRDHNLTCRFHGKNMEIMKDDDTVVGAGVRGDNGIYVLQRLQVPADEPQM